MNTQWVQTINYGDGSSETYPQESASNDRVNIRTGQTLTDTTIGSEITFEFHAYSKPGTYTATVTFTSDANPNLTASATVQVIVIAPPSA
ncbi:MAG: hypothetical protein JOZ49_19430 [Mycolicibacterium sp.]|nr:hypothetical protein [Mycolicibacterium sp.]